MPSTPAISLMNVGSSPPGRTCPAFEEESCCFRSPLSESPTLESVTGFPCSPAKVANQFRPLGSVSSFVKAVWAPTCVVVDVESDQIDVVAPGVIGCEIPCRVNGTRRIPLEFEVRSVDRPHGCHDLLPIGVHCGTVTDPVEIPTQPDDGLTLPTVDESRGQGDEILVVVASGARPQLGSTGVWQHRHVPNQLIGRAIQSREHFRWVGECLPRPAIEEEHHVIGSHSLPAPVRPPFAHLCSRQRRRIGWLRSPQRHFVRVGG